MNARAPLKVLRRVGRRADDRSGGRLSGATATPPETTTDRVDEQLSALLESIEIESSERSLPRRVSRPPYSTAASARPLGRAQTAKATIDREPALRRVVAKSRSIDPVVRDRFVHIVASVIMGILVAFVVLLVLHILQDQAG